METEDFETITLSFPLDSEGFLRRACEHCNREFKWLHDAQEAESESANHCPYCGLPGSEWATNEQQEYMQAMALNSPKMKAAFEQFQHTLSEFNQEGNFLGLHISAENFPPTEPAPLQEPEDMRVVPNSCHSTVPVKVHEDWTGPIYCLACGKTDIIAQG